VLSLSVCDVCIDLYTPTSVRCSQNRLFAIFSRTLLLFIDAFFLPILCSICPVLCATDYLFEPLSLFFKDFKGLKVGTTTLYVHYVHATLHPLCVCVDGTSSFRFLICGGATPLLFCDRTLDRLWHLLQCYSVAVGSYTI